MRLSKGKCSFGEFDIVAITVIQNKLCIVVIFAHNFLVHIIVNTYEMIQSLCIECDVIWSLWLLDFFSTSATLVLSFSLLHIHIYLCRLKGRCHFFVQCNEFHFSICGRSLALFSCVIFCYTYVEQ